MPIISLSTDSFSTEEGKLAKIDVIRSGDPGMEVNVTVQVAQVIGVENQSSCTFWQTQHTMLTVNDNACYFAVVS